MKRNITELEQKLLLNGWKLIYKTYKGKKSQFVWSYVYQKAYPDYIAKVILDAKRSKTLDIFIENKHIDYINILDLQDLAIKYDNLCQTIHFLEFGEPMEESWTD